MRRACLVFCLLLSVSVKLAHAEEQYSQALALVRSTCTESLPEEIARSMGMSVQTSADVVLRGQVVGWRASFTSGISSFLLQRLAPGNRFRGARLEWWRNQRAELALTVGNDCQLQIARRMHYDKHGQVSAVIHLDHQLNHTPIRDLLNPPVPSSKAPKGVAIAIIDSGVNYTLAEINQRLARGKNGLVLGYDFWDLDRRPFDSNPDRSPFFPRRHGTRTASLVIRENPDAVLVPYRYPRPDMSRMRDLLEDLKNRGIKIVAMPLGSKRKSEWEVFAEAAQRLNHILFVVSAGNNGVNIDFNPIYPAGLNLENMIVVTSADDSGRPAEGSNWGQRLVDLLVPAENQKVTDFDGSEIHVSGSSYAVSRIAAMAARILQQHPRWRAAELKQAIFNRAVQDGSNEWAGVGLLPDPQAQMGEVLMIGYQGMDRSAVQHGYELSLSIVRLEDSGWRDADIPVMTNELRAIFSQCKIGLSEVRYYTLQVAPRLLDFDAMTAHTLTEQIDVSTPTVYLVRDTLRRPAYDGEAFGQANTQRLPWLRDSVWLTAGMTEPGAGLAHELFHVLTNSGAHVAEQGNLMQERTQPGVSYLSDMQCRQAIERGSASGLLIQRVN